MHWDASYVRSFPRRRRQPARRDNRPSLPSASSSPPSPTASSLPNLNLANGSCYASAHIPLDHRFLPCGNAAAAGPQACCWRGDTCLADRACFGIHDGSYVTYLAGCTDETYMNGNVCPDKAPADSTDAWAGLIYCHAFAAWLACPQPDAPTVLASAAPCACPTGRPTAVNPAFSDSPTLSSTARLPSSAGGSIEWIPPFSPTYASTVSSATEGTANSAATTTYGSTTGSSQPPSPAKSANSTSVNTSRVSSAPNIPLTVGICVGVGGFALMAALFALAVCLVSRRRHDGSASWKTLWGRPRSPGGKDKEEQNDCEERADNCSPVFNDSTPKTPDEPTVVSELEPRAARPWSMRSELEGTSSRAEAPTPDVRSSIGTLLTEEGQDSAGAAAGSSSDQHTGSSERATTVGEQRHGHPPLETLVELEG